MLKPVERDNLSNQVFRQLRDDILNGEHQPGDRLPSERELCDILGVNRSSVREALKRLEQARLIETRHGGGSVVLDFHLTGSLDLMRDLVMHAGRPDTVAVRSILEARLLLGQGIVQYAAKRICSADVEKLEGIVEKIEACTAGETTRFLELDFEFHYIVARASENLAFILILNSFRDVYRDHQGFFKARLTGVMGERGAYRRITEAFADRDEELARRLYSVLIEEGNRDMQLSFEETAR